MPAVQFRKFSFFFFVFGLFPFFTQATTVQFQTVMGDFTVNLYDETTVETVDNFLAYVEEGAYSDIIIHRSVNGFVVQGGGFSYDGDLPLNSVQTDSPVTNEPLYSNVRGTIAMAKLGSNPNSATSQWFFNLADNSANLDVQNGGFTVFGEVTGNGMAIVDAMAALTEFNLGGAFTSIPLRDFTAEDVANSVEPNEDNFVLIYDIVVLDAAEDTAADLNPTPNTLINNPGNGGGDGYGSGGGAFGFLFPGLLVLLLVLRGRRPR